eukprot:3694133-Amphidinium_carterae.1
MHSGSSMQTGAPCAVGMSVLTPFCLEKCQEWAARCGPRQVGSAPTSRGRRPHRGHGHDRPKHEVDEDGR